MVALLATIVAPRSSSAQCDIDISTGFDQDEGVALAEGVLDEDYLAIGPDGTEATPYTLVSDGFPIPPWFANSESSLWIVPNADLDANAAPGRWVYSITFEIDDGDPELATLVGQWATDNSGVDIVINGMSAGLTSGGFGAWSVFPPDAGAGLFVEGENTIEFHVDNAPPGDNPTGLRVEACVGLPAPEERPLNISTGFDAEVGATVGDSEPDPTYTIRGSEIVGSVAAMAIPEVGFPDFPPWRTNTVNSRWIGPDDSEAIAVAGEYTYGMVITLPVEVDVSLAMLDCSVASDDELLDVLVNGEPLGLSFAGSEELTALPVGAGQGAFRRGANTIEFVVNNFEEGPTGLRVDGEIVEGPPPVDQEATLFGLETGFDDDTGATIGNSLPDDHWVIIGPPDSGLFEEATVVPDDVWPIVPEVWTASSARAKWIGTSNVSSNGPEGVYTFRVLVEIPDGVDAEEAAIIGRWTSDNQGVDVLVNGVSTGTAPTGNFRALEPIPPDAGFGLFENGINTVDIVIQNAGPGEGPVGLFVEAIVGTGVVDPSDLSTGISARGIGPLPAGMDDERYLFVGPDRGEVSRAVVVGSPQPSWLANSTTSKWIGLDGGTSNGAAGDYTYIFEFTAPAEVNPDRVALVGGWAAASSGVDIVLNGESLELTADGPGALTPFPDGAGLGKMLIGANTLEFVVHAESPTALRVEARIESVPRDDPFDISTGVVDGATLGDGELDDKWEITDVFGILDAATTMPAVDVPADWIANANTSRWVGPVNALVAEAGEYAYVTRVTLDTQEQADSAVIRGLFAADNDVLDVRINDQSTGLVSTGSFVAYTPFPERFGRGLFQVDENEIRILVSNAGAAANPSGLRVDAVVDVEGEAPPDRRRFMRGDATQDGALNLTDAVRIFRFLFLGDEPPTCRETMDADNNGTVVLTDGVVILNYLFQGGAALASPHRECGLDPDAPGSRGDLGCESHPPCE